MNNEHDIFNTLKKETLSEAERALLLSRLAEYQAMKPAARRATTPARSPFTLFSFSRSMPAMASLALFLLIGGGVAQAAEGALPGDILYPIKTAVTEEVRVALAVDAEARAEAEAWRAERRLEEAQKLAVGANLTVEKKDALEENFTKHASAVEQRIAVISEEDPVLAADLATTFEATLSAHEAILASLDTVNATSLRDSVQVRLTNISNARHVAVLSVTDNHTTRVAADISTATFSEKISAPVSEEAEPVALTVTNQAEGAADTQQDNVRMRAAERMYESAGEALKKTRSTFNEKRGFFTADEQARIETQLDDAQTIYADGEALFKEGSYSDSFVNFQKVALSMKKLDVLLHVDAKTRDRIRIREVRPIDPLPGELPIFYDPPQIRSTIDIDLPDHIGTNDGIQVEVEVDGTRIDLGPTIERIENGL